MKKFRPFAIVLAAFLGFALLGACAKWSVMRGPFTEDGINPDFVQHVVDKADKRLDLTPGQRQSFQRSVEKTLLVAREQRQEGKELKSRLIEQVRQDRLDPDALDGLFDRKMAQVEALYRLGREEFVAFHASLSAEQRDKLAKAIEEHPEGHGPHGW